MSAQENKTLSNRVAQALGEGDLDALDDLMAPDAPASSLVAALAEEWRTLADVPMWMTKTSSYRVTGACARVGA